MYKQEVLVLILISILVIFGVSTVMGIKFSIKLIDLIWFM